MGSHAPSERPGACDPCRAGDHGSCLDLMTHTGGACTHQSTSCSCYDHSWEWHEQLGYDRDVGPLTQSVALPSHAEGPA